MCQAVADKRGAAVPLQGQQEGQGALGPALHPTPAQNTTPATHRTCSCPWPCLCAAPLSALFPTFARKSGLRCRPHFLNFLRPQAGPAWCTPLPFFFFDTPVLRADAQALQPQAMGAPGSRRAVPPVPSCVASHQHRAWQAELNKYCFSGSSI